MLFLVKKHQLKMKPFIKSRKEKDSFLVHENMSKTSIITSDSCHRTSPRFYEKRASLCTFRQKGSITVEAALAVPIFFFALIAIIYLMEIMAVQMCVRMGMHSALDQIVNETSILSYMAVSEIEDTVIAAIGEDKLDQSILVNGSEGLDCSESGISLVTGIVTLHVAYFIKLPIPFFGEYGMRYEEEMKVKGWTGYEAGVLFADEELVYITDTGSVYHVDYNCTHLQLSISSASFEDLADLRNEYGGTYSACSKCVDGAVDEIYIASTGAHYHNDLECSGLTRTIYTIPLSEAIGMALCSRCGT